MLVASIWDNQFFLSGVNAYWQSMAASLAAMELDVATVGLDSQVVPWNREYFDALAGQSVRLDVSGERHAFLKCAHCLLNSLRPALLIHHYSDFGFETSLRCRELCDGASWRNVYVCHSDDPDHYERVSRWKDVLDGVICVSRQTRDYVVDRLGIPPDRVGVVHYVWHDGTAEMPGRLPARPAEHEVAPQRPIQILYAGRLEAYQKRAGDLVAFALRLGSLGVPHCLHVAGCGSLEDNLKAQLSIQRRSGHVIFHGFLPPERLYQLMHRCDLYVSFSEFEGVSTSLIQGMGCGLVPLVTKTFSGSEFLTSHENALLFEVGDIGAAARCVLLFADDPSKFRMMSDRAILSVAAKFSAQRQKMQLKQVLESVCG